MAKDFRKAEMGQPKTGSLICLKVETADGQFVACYSDKGLAQLDFPGQPRRDEKITSTQAAPAPVKAWHAMTERAINAVLSGRTPSKLPPMDLSTGTAFQQKVWSVLAGIQSGRTLSYGEVAEALGKPGAARAVGRACGANPIPVLVPCHRVLAANRIIGGFSGGLDWKRKLLTRENVVV